MKIKMNTRNHYFMDRQLGRCYCIFIPTVCFILILFSILLFCFDRAPVGEDTKKIPDNNSFEQITTPDWQPYGDILDIANEYQKPDSIQIEMVDRDAVLPKYKTKDCVGFNLYLPLNTKVVLSAYASATIPLGFKLKIPDGHHGYIHGVESENRNGLIICNKIINSDFTGLLLVEMANLSSDTICILGGEKIAEMVIRKHVRLEIDVVDDIDNEYGY